MERYWTEGEQSRLAAARRKVPAEDWEGRRDAALIGALLHSGCRIGEFVQVSVGDALAALRTRHLFIPREHRKGGARDHKVLVTQALETDLRELLAVRAMLVAGDCLKTDALLATRRGAGMTVRNAQLRIKAFAVAAGLPADSSPHWARHTRGMNIMACSTARDPRGVAQAALGHADIRSTGIYTQTPRAEVEAVLTAIDTPAPGRITRAQLRREYEGRATA